MEMCKTLEEKHEEVGQGLVSNHRVIELSIHCYWCCWGWWGLETQ